MVLPTMILKGFYNPAKPHPTCILPSVRGGIFYYLRYAKFSFKKRGWGDLAPQRAQRKTKADRITGSAGFQTSHLFLGDRKSERNRLSF